MWSFFWLHSLTSSVSTLLNTPLSLSVSSSDLPSSPRAVPAVPGWCVVGKDAAPSSATTANRPGIPTRPATRPANRGLNHCTPTATTHPATHRSRDPVSTWKTHSQWLKSNHSQTVCASAWQIKSSPPAFPTWKYSSHLWELSASPSPSVLITRQSVRALSQTRLASVVPTPRRFPPQAAFNRAWDTIYITLSPPDRFLTAAPCFLSYSI